MKRTVIMVKELADGRVRIVGIQSAIHADEFYDIFGREVAVTYLDGFPRYVRENTNAVRIVTEHRTVIYMEVGDLFVAEDFNRAVSVMKEAGKRLQAIIKHEKTAEVKAVII